MSAAFQTVLPIFGLILLGFAVGRPPLFGPEAARGLNQFVFLVALPALLFRSMAKAGLPGAEDLTLLATYYAATALVGLPGLFLARRFFRVSLADGAAAGLGAAFSNTVQIGVPLVLATYGAPGLRHLLLIITFHAALLLGVATLIVEIARAGGRPWHAVTASLRALVLNPIVLAILAGVAWGQTGLGLPDPVGRVIDMLAGAAVPCALFSLGMALVGLGLRDAGGPALLIAVLKLAALPAVVWLLGRHVFDLGALPLAVATLTAALPTGANVHVFAQRYKALPGPIASAVVVTTALAVATTSWLIPRLGG